MTKKNLRAQVGIEFLIIVTAVIFFVSLFLLSIQSKQEEKTYQHQMIELSIMALVMGIVFIENSKYPKQQETKNTKYTQTKA